jgi:signal transduction histidine kinase
VSAFGRAFGVLLRWRSPTGRATATAWAVALIVPSLIAVVAGSFRLSVGLTGFLLCVLPFVAIVALVGGRRPALAAVAVGFLAAGYAFATPTDAFRLDFRAENALLVVFAVVGSAVAILVDQLARLLEEQTSLRRVESAVRRVATLVAREASAEELFAAATEEVAGVLEIDMASMARFEADGEVTVLAGWRRDGERIPVGSRRAVEDGSLSALVAASGRPARIDSASEASRSAGAVLPGSGIRSAVAVPITVQARLWGIMVAGSTAERPLPAGTEAQLLDFTELLATAMANAESTAWLARLAEEQAALRRIATLVVRGMPQEKVFAAAVEEVGRLLPVDYAYLWRFEPDGSCVVVGSWGKEDRQVPIGFRREVGGKNLVTMVVDTLRSARIDNYSDASGPLGEFAQAGGVRSAVGTPILVEDTLWGVVAAGSRQEQPLPADTEGRLRSLTELLASAIASGESRAGLARLAEEQAALRRVATLVARKVPQEEVFAAVTEEVLELIQVDTTIMGRYESDDSFTSVARAGGPDGHIPVGSRLPLGGKNLATTVFETGRPARLDSYAETASGPVGSTVREADIRSSVATPIAVEGRLWGLIAAGSTHPTPLPADTEARLSSFTDLVATAIANTESRADAARLADQQTALRHVATLVARGVAPEEVFASVTDSIERLLPVDFAYMSRYEPDGTVVVLASSGRTFDHFSVGARWKLGGRNLATTVLETGRPGRLDGFLDASGPLGATGRDSGIRSAAATPILVEDRVWGIVIAGSTLERPLPPETEARLADFTDLVATALANAQSRAALRPVERMRSQAERITESQLSARLPVSDDSGEVTALGRTLNSMLDRVEEAVTRERRVVSDASHELRTPLTTLRAEVDLALMGDRGSAELRAALESASEEAKRMSRLADDLLVLARADQGRLPLHPRPLAARELLEDAAGRARAGAEIRGRSVAIAGPCDGCDVRADPDRAAQALDNLITNALLYGDGTITLSARITPRHVELHVTDEGRGFPRDLLPRAFERFGRGPHARATEPGSGLGLALVEAVATAHGGGAAVSNRPGGGADVSFTLPRA